MGLIPRRSATRAFLVGFVVLLVTSCVALAAVPAAASDPGQFLWKSVSAAQCKLDDKIPLAWNVFQTDNKKQANLVLILLGRRYLALDLKAKTAYTVLLADITMKGPDIETGDLFVPSRVLPTEEWSVRDVGPAELIRLTLKDYGRRLQIELPHPADLRAFY
jgi:hypothetical protein